MTQNPSKHCGGCNQDLPRTPEFFYMKRDAGRFVPSARCKPCSIERAKARHRLSDKFHAAQLRKAERRAAAEARLATGEARRDAAGRVRLQRSRERTSPANRLRDGMRTRLSHYRTRAGGLHPDVDKDNCSGCSFPELVRHIEAQWYDGMSWTNYGSWHIDHIVPISSVDLNDFDAAMRVFHFSNLQPLWAHENVKKGARLVAPAERISA